MGRRIPVSPAAAKRHCGWPRRSDCRLPPACCLLGAGSGGAPAASRLSLASGSPATKATPRLVAWPANERNAGGAWPTRPGRDLEPDRAEIPAALLPPCRSRSSRSWRRWDRVCPCRGCGGAEAVAVNLFWSRWWRIGRSILRNRWSPIGADWNAARRTRRAELMITRKLEQLGFDVPIVEDMSRRHMHYVIDGWRSAVRCHARERVIQPCTRSP